MQSLSSLQSLAARPSSVKPRVIQPTSCSVQIRNAFISGPRSTPFSRGSSRQLYFSRSAGGGGADTLEQRVQEAKDWISAWKGNGSSSGNGATSSKVAENGSAAIQGIGEDDDDDDDEFEYAEGDGEDIEENQFEEDERELSEGPFKYNISNSKKEGDYSPDYTLSDGSVVFTSETLAKK